MTRPLQRLVGWARRIVKRRCDPFRATEVIDPAGEDDQLIYRLRRWPKLPSASMTTHVSRALSIMSTRPVNRRWLLNNSSLQVHEVDSMLRHLVEQEAVEVTDAAKYRSHTSTA
ncbi:hypothetical protein ACFPOE_11800 [Caenimonas terrae]|uniref:Winged helix-turn-helix domain-containing protein n=1 Tax=Caenimonas terrae TaxID=696074 RepID=A0ABW0NGG5_9BURK